MTMRATKLVLAMGLVTGLSLTAAAQGPAQTPAPPPKHNTCFYSSEFQGWKAPDAHTIFIRVGVHRYFRLDLANACQTLLWPDSHLITHVRGSDSICSAIDWDMKVSQSPNGIPEACIVKTMTELTPAEVAAIPPKFKP
jgi:hypothetical protein